MRTAGSRDQGLGIGHCNAVDECRASRLELAQRVRECAVEGCHNLTMDAIFCVRCQEELEALNRTTLREEQERIDRSERWDTRCRAAIEMWLTAWDWLGSSKLVDVLLAAFVVLGWVYMCLVYGEAFLRHAQ